MLDAVAANDDDNDTRISAECKSTCDMLPVCRSCPLIADH